VILAGIDEAGYGPRLGPLVVAANAFRTSSAPSGAWPRLCLFADAAPVRIADSKDVYSFARGLGALESAVLGFAAAGARCPADLGEFLKAHCVEGAKEALRQPWYSYSDLPLPRSMSSGSLERLAAEIRIRLAAEGFEHLWARFCLVDEARYNELLFRTGNKAMLLFGRTAILMRRLWEDYGPEGVYLTVDRHGGRKFYGGLLDMIFPDAKISILCEGDDESAYGLTGEGRTMRVRFVVRAESLDSSVALSSMWAKYVREVFMQLLNDYWLARAGDLRPTAGYWVDAERFLADLRAARVLTDCEAERFIRLK